MALRVCLTACVLSVAACSLEPDTESDESLLAQPLVAKQLNDTMMSDSAWSQYLGGLAPVWHSVPKTFYESPFFGSGGLGMSVFQTGSRKRLSVKLGDSRVRDHQGTGGTVWGNARLPIGEFMLNTAGDVTGVDLQLS